METKEQKEIKSLLKIEKAYPVLEYEGTSREMIRWQLPNGDIHRDYGPAIILKDGTMMWFKNNKSHREDGPALIDDSNKKEQYWVDGKHITKESFEQWKLKNKKK